MTDLKSQRRLSALILKVGQNRVWMNPEKTDDVEAAIFSFFLRFLFAQTLPSYLYDFDP